MIKGDFAGTFDATFSQSASLEDGIWRPKSWLVEADEPGIALQFSARWLITGTTLIPPAETIPILFIEIDEPHLLEGERLRFDASPGSIVYLPTKSCRIYAAMALTNANIIGMTARYMWSASSGGGHRTSRAPVTGGKFNVLAGANTGLFNIPPLARSVTVNVSPAGLLAQIQVREFGLDRTTALNTETASTREILLTGFSSGGLGGQFGGAGGQLQIFNTSASAANIVPVFNTYF